MLLQPLHADRLVMVFEKRAREGTLTNPVASADFLDWRRRADVFQHIGEDPLGTRVRFDDTKDAWMTIVGVAGDSRNLGLDTDPGPLLYIPYHYFTLPFMSVVARSAGGTAAVASAVRAEVRALILTCRSTRYVR